MKTPLMKTSTGRRALMTAAVMIASATGLAAPLNVSDSIGTTVENLGGDFRRITQTLQVNSPNDPETEDEGITFSFDKAASAAGGAYANSTIDSVRVTIRYTVDDIELTVTNTSTDTSFTGGSEDQSSSDNTWQTFNFGAGTAQDLSTPAIASGDYAGTMLTLDLNGVTIEPQSSVSEGPFDYSHTETRDVNSDLFNDYSGAGSFASQFDTLFSTSSTVFGSNIESSQSVGGVGFFAEVEYVVVPEPGTLGMMVIALGGAAGMLLLRRRKSA